MRSFFKFVLVGVVASSLGLYANGQSTQKAQHRIICTPPQQRILRKVQPVYPPEAKAAGIQGEVVIRATIAKDGSVKKIAVVRGHPLLVKSATDAISHWRYKPLILTKVPVETETTINVRFEIPQKKTKALPAKK